MHRSASTLHRMVQPGLLNIIATTELKFSNLQFGASVPDCQIAKFTPLPISDYTVYRVHTLFFACSYFCRVVVVPLGL